MLSGSAVSVPFAHPILSRITTNRKRRLGLPSRFAVEAFFLERIEIVAPAFRLLDAQLIKVVPGENPGVVQVVELDPDRVITDRLQFHDADMDAAGDGDLVSWVVALHLRRGAFDPQVFGGQ